MAELVVELYGTRIGALVGTGQSFDFVPDPDAVARFGLDSPILSVAIPLAAVPTRAGRATRQNFFRELLPEGRTLANLARAAAVGEQDVMGMVARFGRDVAGALQIWNPGAPGEPRQPALQPVSAAEIGALLSDTANQPLGNLPVRGKTSLAGVQDKIVLARTGSAWNRVVSGWPSTHILKPVVRDRPTAIYDEEFGARIARAVGLATHVTWVEEFAGIEALVIGRYDRDDAVPQGRIHQEDFNQALGASGDQKYQRISGRVTLQRIARTVSGGAGPASVERLFRLVVLSVAIGNLDLHAKNISLLHPPDGSLTLAPAYDVVPQAHVPNDGEIAMAIDGECRHAALTLGHLAAEGQTWGLANAADMARDVVVTVAETVAAESPDERATPSVRDDIRRFATNLLEARPVGAPTPLRSR